MTRARIGVLASGGGSNLQALLDYLARLGPARAGDVVLVASDRGSAGALARAEGAGVATAVLSTSAGRAGEQLDDVLTRFSVDLIVLAGYLKLIPIDVTRRFVGRMVNVHPAPLPAFGGTGMYGSRAHQAVLAAGVPWSGPTVHFVDEVFDHGAPIAHWPVPVLAGDDDHALAERVLRAEHLLYPRVIQAVASGRLRLGDDGVVTPPFFRDGDVPVFDPALDDASLGRALDLAIEVGT
ncbi:MAG: phosphoribosylglycinamide formyltransferase [Gemmatimonadota bacterium]